MVCTSPPWHGKADQALEGGWDLGCAASADSIFLPDLIQTLPYPVTACSDDPSRILGIAPGLLCIMSLRMLSLAHDCYVVLDVEGKGLEICFFQK